MAGFESREEKGARPNAKRSAAVALAAKRARAEEVGGFPGTTMPPPFSTGGGASVEAATTAAPTPADVRTESNTTTTSAETSAPTTLSISLQPKNPLAQAVASVAGITSLEIAPDSSVGDLKLALVESGIPLVVAPGEQETKIFIAAAGMSMPDEEDLAGFANWAGGDEEGEKVGSSGGVRNRVVGVVTSVLRKSTVGSEH